MKKIKWGVIGTAGIARSCTIPECFRQKTVNYMRLPEEI